MALSTLPQCSHITKKRGVYYWRRRMPGRVRGEIALSLATRRFREAEHRAEVLDGAFGAAWERAMAQEAESGAGADVGAIVREYLREQLADALSGRPGTLGMWPLGRLEECLADLRDALADRDYRGLRLSVDQLMQRHGLPAEAERPLGIGVLEAELRVHGEAIKRARGDAPLVLTPETVDAPAPIPAPQPSAPKAPIPPAKPLASALVEPFFVRREKVDEAKYQVMNQDRGTLRRFIECAGDRPVDAYGRGDVSAFLDTMRRLPTTYGKSPRDKTATLAELIARAETTGAKRLSDKTLQRHLSALTTFLRFAMDQGHITVAQHGQLTDMHRFQAGKGAREQRDEWTSDELRTLFASPVWTGRDLSGGRRAAPGTVITRDARFWLPILALYHGARLEELADLYRQDVGQRDGVWFIRISEDVRQVKNANAVRTLPLHPELIRLGFPAYVEKIAPAPGDPLFPDLPPQGPDKRRGPRFTRWFVEYRKDLGIYRPGVAAHAFRHAARTRMGDLMQSEQHKRHVNFLFGHAGGNEGEARYDKGPGLRALAETLAMLSYPEVDLSRLHQPPQG